MDLTNIKNGCGFVTEHSLMAKIVRWKPPKGDRLHLRRLEGRLFAEVVMLAYGVAMMPLFKIYAGDRDLYLYIRGMFHDVTGRLGYEATSEEWGADDAQGD